MLCSCSTNKRIYTEKIKTEITYMPNVQRVALPQIKEEIKLKNDIGLDTLIECKNLNVRVILKDSMIRINTEMKDSVDVMTMNKIIKIESQIKESKKVNRGYIWLYFFIFLLIMVLFIR